MSSFALLVIDMQKAYFRNEELEVRRQELIKNCNQLIAYAKNHGIAVFNVMTVHKKDRSTWTLNMLNDEQGYLFEEEPETSCLDGLDIEDATVITKTRDSAFYGTSLARQLQEQAIDTLIILGVSTHGCVLQTAADAYAENFKVIIAREAIASHDERFHQPILDLLTQEYRQPQYDNDQVRGMMGS